MANSKDIVRQIIREEFARGIPEFMLRQATSECTEKLKQHINRFIATRAENPTRTRELQKSADETLVDLDEEIYALIQDRLWEFMQQTLD